MTKKEMRKLNRLQLLELLILQTEENEALKKQLEELQFKNELDTAQISTLGSIAEASIQINDVFMAAQKAADMYFDAAKNQARAIVEDAQARADEIIRKAEESVSE